MAEDKTSLTKGIKVNVMDARVRKAWQNSGTPLMMPLASRMAEEPTLEDRIAFLENRVHELETKLAGGN